MRRPRAVILALAGALVAGGACAGRFDLDGRPCPCAGGYVCCAGTCVAEGAVCPVEAGGDGPATQSDGSPADPGDVRADAHDGSTEVGDGRAAGDGFGPAWLAVQGNSSCAHREGDGGVFCWGNVPTATKEWVTTLSPTRMPEYDGIAVVEFCETDRDRCARDEEGNVTCSGYDFSSLDGFPVRDAVQLVCGQNSACARLRSGEVWCWGQDYGQLGRSDGGQGGGGAVPPARADLLSEPATDIAAGYWFTCAVTQGGAVLCWGWDDASQLGTPPPSPSDIYLKPQAVTGLPAIKRVSLGWRHSCALAVDGTVYCWGLNSVGQLGSDSGGAPGIVQGLPGAVDVLRLGDSHTCVILADRRVFCWGDNKAGELGIGDAGITSTAVPQWTGLTGATLLGAGNAHTCAVASEGFMCWGSDSDGQLGNGDVDKLSSPSPTRVAW